MGAKANLLLDDPSLQDEMGVVDRWIAAGQTTSFHKFIQGDEFGKALLTANDDKTCAFVAVRTATVLVGVPSIYSESEYERFVQDSSINCMMPASASRPRSFLPLWHVCATLALLSISRSSRTTSTRQDVCT
jgi:hypothetical protein